MKRNSTAIFLLTAILTLASAAGLVAQDAPPAAPTNAAPPKFAALIYRQQQKSITQYGITWTFDKEYPVGQFVTGDWWVVGPVTVVSVTPGPGPAPADAQGKEVKSIYGATAMVDDRRMRNGSMVVLKPDWNQGYDSRLKNYKPELSATFPLELPANRSLISTISNLTLPVPIFLGTGPATYNNTKSEIALKTAAVLTCLDKVPPTDAFRPPYAGTEKPIFQTKNLHRELLPKLAPVKDVPSWKMFERFFERPWLDHIELWMTQFTGPNENQSSYGREVGRLTSMASLMLMLDVPQEQKETLLVEFVQHGIDMYGLAKCGRHWYPETAHWNGRKWPILFAGMLLDDKDMKELPGSGHTLFLEDGNTYYGKGFLGDTALYQICLHSFPRPSYEEKDPATWDENDKRSEMYRGVTVGAQAGTALAVQLMKARSLWNHDAFFDYYDRWMDPKKALKQKIYPAWGKTYDAFTDQMWETHRKNIPDQPGATRNLKWVWDTPASKDPKLEDVPDLAWSKWVLGKTVGHYVPNEKPK